MDITQLLNNYLEPYIHASLGSKASNDTHRVTINPSLLKSVTPLLTTVSNTLISKESPYCQLKAISSHAITNKSIYILSYIYLTIPRQSETNCIALILNLKI